ncbi:hypothetical protein CWI38_0047p0080 [Hamiltosporidium tvaerminnensis]|uniref:Integrase zinc-binding domain-containing protein n=1 Tax=Hamiltosporidium tvaerminnensis TaxID=1176355 RepID=A0A4Q9M1R1_9MICR|nr:hypothetical protein CWI38_0047p0080 [Hamiltosporidium tvaerminnensis]
MINTFMIFIPLAYMFRGNSSNGIDQTTFVSEEISTISSAHENYRKSHKAAQMIFTEDDESTISCTSDDKNNLEESKYEDYSRIDEYESNEVPNNIYDSNLCGGFYYPGSEKRFIFANSPIFRVYFKLSRVKIAIESFKSITSDFQREINKKQINNTSIDVLLFSLNTIGSFSDLSFGYIESYAKNIEDSLAFLKVGITFLQNLISYAESYCDGFEKTLSELNDKYRIFLQEIIKGLDVECNSSKGASKKSIVVQGGVIIQCKNKKRGDIKGCSSLEGVIITQVLFKIEHSVAHSGINRMIALIGKKYYRIPRTFIIKYAKVCGACSRFNYLKKIQKIYMKNITNNYDIFMIDCVNLGKYADQKDGIVGPESNRHLYNAFPEF